MVEMQGTVMTTLLQRMRTRTIGERDLDSRRASMFTTGSSVIPNASLEFENEAFQSRIYRRFFRRRNGNVTLDMAVSERNIDAASEQAVISVADNESFYQRRPAIVAEGPSNQEESSSVNQDTIDISLASRSSQQRSTEAPTVTDGPLPPIQESHHFSGSTPRSEPSLTSKFPLAMPAIPELPSPLPSQGKVITEVK